MERGYVEITWKTVGHEGSITSVVNNIDYSEWNNIVEYAKGINALKFFRSRSD